MGNAGSVSDVSKLGFLESQSVLASIRFGDPSPADAQRPLVLVAVLEPRLASFLDRVLVAAEYDVECVAPAVDAMDGHTPDVVLLEAHVPLLREVRAKTDVPIVAL